MDIFSKKLKPICNTKMDNFSNDICINKPIKKVCSPSRSLFAIVDRRMDKIMKERLIFEGYTIIDSYDHNNLYNAIRSHVDIGLFKAGNFLITSKESYDYYEHILGNKLMDDFIVSGIKKLDSAYPNDIAYNFSFSGKYGIGKLDSIDNRIIYSLLEGVFTKDDIYHQEEKLTSMNFDISDNLMKNISSSIGFKGNIELINVNQGYASCSICWVDEKSLITSDKGIVEALKSYEIDVLEISSGFIDLFDMDYGFIGGATGMLEDGKIVFFGDVFSHPDGQKMVDFIVSKSKKYICLSKGTLKDYGSLLIVS